MDLQFYRVSPNDSYCICDHPSVLKALSLGFVRLYNKNCSSILKRTEEPTCEAY